jgi:CheY-like chemotaxis protein
MAKLMLVEDDNNLREIYEARLQAEGYEIVSAKDGEEALVLAKAQKPDLIIADVMMPKISGFEMLDILRNTEGLKQVKVIMLTALGQNDDQKLANRLGANRYLVKSQVTLEDIVKVTHELLGDEQAPTATPGAPQPPGPPPSGPPPATPAAGPAGSGTPPVAGSPPASTEPPADTTATPPPEVPTAADNPITPPTTIAVSDDSAPEPAVPVPDPTPAAPAPEPPVTSPADAASDDKLVADAAQQLVDSTEEAKPATPDTTAAAMDSPKTTDSSDTHKKKVITPLDTKPKRDLDTLLALEEAKEATTAPPAAAIPVVVADNPGRHPATAPQNPVVEPVLSEDTASGAPAASPQEAAQTTANNPADPNSIAL